MPASSNELSERTRIAQCACGTAAITVCGEPEMNGVCHCTNCKRRTGSAFGISAYFRRTDVMEKKGTMRTYAFHHAAQNHDQVRYFCAGCGSTLYWTISVLPELIGIAGGCFADDHLAEPNMSVSHNKKLSWVELPEAWRRAELT
jgi:hypothetical protein